MSCHRTAGKGKDPVKWTTKETRTVSGNSDYKNSGSQKRKLFKSYINDLQLEQWLKNKNYILHTRKITGRKISYIYLLKIKQRTD